MSSSSRVYELRVTRSSKIFVGFLLLGIAQACQAQCNKPLPLSRHVSHFRLGPTSALNALLWLGRDSGVCFGVEYSGPELNSQIRIDEDESTVRDLARKILGNAFQISVSEGVVVVRKKGVDPPGWLNHKLIKFETPHAELMNTGSLLWMTLEMSLDRTKHGFGGSGPVSEPRDEIGPFAERDKTVQQLLIKIVGSSHGSAWFPTNRLLRTSFDANVNRFWTLATYSTRNLFRP